MNLSSFSWQLPAVLLCSAPVLLGQISVSSLADRTYAYNNSVTFTVNSQAGYDYLALLDTRTIPVVCQQIDWSGGGDGIVARGELRIARAADPPKKTLPLDGEVFEVSGHTDTTGVHTEACDATNPLLERLQPRRPLRSQLPDLGQALLQDAQFVGLPMRSDSGHPGSMHFVNRLSDAPRQLDAMPGNQRSMSGLPWHLALHPHLKRGNDS